MILQCSCRLPTSVGLSQALPNYSVSTTPFIYSNDAGISIWCFLLDKDKNIIVAYVCKQHLNSYVHILIICIHTYPSLFYHLYQIVCNV